MRRIRLVSLPSAFIAGAVCATALAAIPAIADVVPGDRNPAVFDGASPLLTVQPAMFVLGDTIGAAEKMCPEIAHMYNGARMKLAWNAQDTGSGAASFDIAANTPDGGDRLVVRGTTATSRDFGVSNYDNDCGGGYGDSYWWVTARDHRGYTATSPMISDEFDVWDENGAFMGIYPDLPVSRTGTWSTSNCVCHNHGKTTFTSTRGASLTYTVAVDKPGRTLAVVAPTGNTRGAMTISVDGGTPSTVITYISSPVNVNRVIVWQRTLDAGVHTVRIVNAGTAGHPRIDVDTLMLGPAWSGEAGRYWAEDLGW